MKQLHITDSQVKGYVLEIIRQMSIDGFKPELVIGLVRGGAVPANYISQFYDIPCILLNKDYNTVDVDGNANRVLVIDDINDTGISLTDVNNALFATDVEIKYATLITNSASGFEVDYTAYEINKLEDPCWIVFPWENWWTSLD